MSKARLLSLLLPAALLFAPAPGLAQKDGARQSPAPPSGVFPSAVDVVNVDVVVLDKQGQPVEGLTQADFTIREDGKPQNVSTFEAVALPESAPLPETRRIVATNTAPAERVDRWFFVVYDDVNISITQTSRAQQVLVEFLTRGPQDGDHVMIVPASGGATWSGRIPEDRPSLIQFAKRLEGRWRPETGVARIWDYEAMAIAMDRDPQLKAQVVRRWFDNNLIPEAFPSADLNRELDVSPGLAQIRIKAREVYTEAVSRLRTTLQAVDRLAASLADRRGRKTLLLVSEGFIMDPAQPEFRQLVQTARNANAAVYYVDVRSPGGMVGQAGMPGGGAEFGRDLEDQDASTALSFTARAAEGARSVAFDTGGRVIAGSNVADNLVKVAREARAYYMLGYTSTNAARDGRFRKIEVRVTRPDVEVRARRGYYAPSAESAPRPAGSLDPAVRAALDTPLPRAGIPLRLTSYVEGILPDGRRQVLLVGEAEPTALQIMPQAGRYEAKLDSYVLVNGRDDGAVEKQEKLVELSVPEANWPQVQAAGIRLRREFDLPAGAYQARLLLRDQKSGKLGSVQHAFEVPAPQGFQVSTPVLTDALQPVAGGQPVPVPIARRTFRPGSRLACAFEIFGADRDVARGGPRVSLSYRLLGPDGAPLGSAQQTLRGDANGRIAPLLVVALPAGAAGEHELELTLRDELTGTGLEITEPFTIQP